MITNYCHISGIKVYFGDGTLANAAIAVRELCCSRPLIITDPVIYKSDMLEPLYNSLNNAGMSWNIFTDIVPNAPTDNIDSAVNSARMNDNDIVIAVGGGSTIDTGKTTCVMAKQAGSINDYFPNTQKKFRLDKLPLLAIPTTSGTGSEMSIYAVHTNSLNHNKFSYTGSLFTSSTVILDPQLTLNMPREITVSTGTDALVHAIESYTSKPAIQLPFPFINSLSLEAIRLIRHNLPMVLAQPDNMEARLNMMFAASMGGVAIGYGVGAAHGMDSALIHHYGMSHGIAVGQLIPNVMEYNRSYCRKQMIDIANAMGVETNRMNAEEASFQAVSIVKDFLSAIGLPPLKNYVSSLKDLIKNAPEMLISYNVIENIRPFQLNDIHQLLSNAF